MDFLKTEQMDFLFKRTIIRGGIMALIFAAIMGVYHPDVGFVFSQFDRELFFKNLGIGIIAFPMANLISGFVIWNIRQRKEKADEQE